MLDFIHDNGTYYRTTEEITGRGYTVPAGFRFNVSSPAKYHWFVHPHDRRYFEAAAVHDYALHVLGWGRWKAAVVWSKHLWNKGVPIWKQVILFLVLGSR